MRCVSCNANLSDYEATLKSVTTGQYLDLCGNCLHEVPEIRVLGNNLLNEYGDVDGEENIGN